MWPSQNFGPGSLVTVPEPEFTAPCASLIIKLEPHLPQTHRHQAGPPWPLPACLTCINTSCSIQAARSDWVTALPLEQLYQVYSHWCVRARDK